MLDRRNFLGAALAGGCLSTAGCGSWVTSNQLLAPSTKFFVPGYKTEDFDAVHSAPRVRKRLERNLPRQYDDTTVLMSMIRPDGSTDQALFPLRGHDVEISPDGKIGHINALEFETYVTFDAETLDIIATSKPFKTDWFGGGHSAFVNNGAYLAVSERAPKSVFTGKATDHHGYISLRDPETLRVVGGFSSYGISPHEIKVLADGKHLAVSNTGTIVPEGRDDYGVPRKVFEPALAIIEIESGKLIDRLPGDGERELRHIAAGQDRTVFGIQTELVRRYEENETQLRSPWPIPTAVEHQYNPAPTLGYFSNKDEPTELGNRFQQPKMVHGLSIEFDPDHDEFIATYPDVHRVMVFDASSGEVKRVVRTDWLGFYSPCGVAVVPGQDFYVIAGYWEGLYVFEKGSHHLLRELSHAPITYGHSHIAVSTAA